jgi:hypothetical protein
MAEDNRLYGLVQTYAGLGEHRTGTPPDDATVEWFADELTNRGAEVELRPYRFDRYDATCSVTVGERPVDCFPLFYEATGTVRSEAPTVGSADVWSVLRNVPVHEELVERARAEGTGMVVLAIQGAADERLMVPNRSVAVPGDVPVVLVEGGAAARFDEPIAVDFDARVVEGRSSNVVGRFGDDRRDPLIVATPLSGWFRCAGERGTGIAVALELATRLSDRVPVVVVGTTGHEFHDLGLQQLLLEHGFPAARAVLHLGASIAASGPSGGFSPTRLSMACVPDALTPELIEAFGPLEIAPQLVPAKEATDPDRWIGEAREWCRLGVPLVSVTGHHRYMHTRNDLPELATSPDLLAVAADALAEVGTVLARA